MAGRFGPALAMGIEDALDLRVVVCFELKEFLGRIDALDSAIILNCVDLNESGILQLSIDASNGRARKFERKKKLIDGWGTDIAIGNFHQQEEDWKGKALIANRKLFEEPVVGIFQT